MKLLYLRYEPTHSDFILDASAIKTIVPVLYKYLTDENAGGAR